MEYCYVMIGMRRDFFKYFVFFIILITSFSTKSEEFTLPHFLKEVEQSNLELKIQGSKLNAAQANAKGLRIPAPEARVFQNKFKNDSATGFEISQSIPYPGKIKDENTTREEMFLAEKEATNFRLNEILSNAKLAYFEYWLQFEILDILQEKKKIIEHHMMLSRSLVRSDSMMKIHLLKAESDLAMLENDLQGEKQKLNEKRLKIAEFLNKDANFSISKPMVPPLSTITDFSSGDATQVKALMHNVAGLRAAESESKKSWIPDFKVSYMEMKESLEMPGYQQISVGITLPFVFPWERNAKSQEASAQRIASEYELEKTTKQIEYTKSSLLSETETIKKQLDLLNLQLIPKAKERLNLVQNIVPRDKESLMDHRETMENFVELKMKSLELRWQYEKAVAELSKYVPPKENFHE